MLFLSIRKFFLPSPFVYFSVMNGRGKCEGDIFICNRFIKTFDFRSEQVDMLETKNKK